MFQLNVSQKHFSFATIYCCAQLFNYIAILVIKKKKVLNKTIHKNFFAIQLLSKSGYEKKKKTENYTN